MSDTPNITREPTPTGKIVVILTELRAFIIAGGPGIHRAEGRWLLAKVDEALSEIGVLDVIQRIHHDRMEGES